MEKATKGTKQYEEWLRKYQQKKRASLEGKKDEPEKSNTKTYDELVAKPPVFVEDKELWHKAVAKVTYGGKKKASYGAAVALYKLKVKKKNEEAIKKTADLAVPLVEKFKQMRDRKSVV